MTSHLMYISIFSSTDLDLGRRTLKCKLVQPLMVLYACMKFHEKRIKSKRGCR